MSELFADAAPAFEVPLPPEPLAEEGHSSVPHIGVQERGTPPERLADKGDKLAADLSYLLTGERPELPKPTVLARNDGHSLLYAGQLNVLFGDPESGKTWIALAACSETAKAAARAVVLDLDHNGKDAVVARLLALGVEVPYLADRSLFRYYAPEDSAEFLAAVAFLRTWRPAVVVLDSIGELVPLFGRNSNSPDDYTEIHTKTLKPLASAGACLIAVDHLAKNSDSRAHGATGTAAKRRAVGGVSLRVTVKDAFAPGSGGSAYLAVHKDRHGGLREHCGTDREPLAGVFTLTADGDRLTWDLKTPKDSDSAYVAGVKATDLDKLTAMDPPPQSVAQVKKDMGWGSDRATAALSAWRTNHSEHSGNVPGTSGTDDEPAFLRSSPPMSGTEERA